MQVYGLEHYYCVNGVEWCWPRGISHSKHVLLFARQYTSAGADVQDPVRLAPRMSISPLNYSMTSKSTEVVTVEFESHGRENWHSPRSYDVHGSHGLMFIALLVDTSCNAVAQLLHMQVRFPGLSNGASLATAIPESPRHPLHI